MNSIQSVPSGTAVPVHAEAEEVPAKAIFYRADLTQVTHRAVLNAMQHCYTLIARLMRPQ
jgi:hypothetical protein